MAYVSELSGERTPVVFGFIGAICTLTVTLRKGGKGMTDEAFKEMTSFQNMYQAYKKAATFKRGKKKVMSKFVLTKSPKNGGKIKGKKG